MDQIGTSHIATADIIVCGVALILILGLLTLPQNTVLSRLCAVLSGCAVVFIITFMIISDINRKAVDVLAMIAFVLCQVLWKWNRERIKTNSQLPVEPVGSSQESGVVSRTS